MAISVDWPTGVITIPKADTVLVGTDPISGREIRSYDTDAYHEELREQEETVAGRAWPITHLWNAAQSLGGVTYAPQFITVNNYQHEFEDGTYRVVFTSTNNDIADFSVVNNVSIQPGNSAGLQLVLSGSGLDTAQDTRLRELHEEKGLAAGKPLTVTPGSRAAGDWSQTITGDGETSTVVTRD